mgnify:CR=1 FL=1
MINPELKEILNEAKEIAWMYSDLCDGDEEIESYIKRIEDYLKKNGGK